MAIKLPSLAQRFDAIKLSVWEQDAPALGWVIFRWLAWVVGVALALTTARNGALPTTPLALLAASTLLGLLVTFVLLSRTRRRVLVVGLVTAFDVVAAAMLVRFTDGLQSSFLAYTFTTTAAAGWLLGARVGAVGALLSVGLAAWPTTALGSLVGYGVALLSFGALASWLARQGELLAERTTLQRRLQVEAQRTELLQETVRKSAAQVVPTLDPSRIYLATTAAARELLKVGRAALLIADEATGELRLVHDAGGPGDVAPRRFAVPLSGPADWVGDGRRLIRLLSSHGMPATLAAPLRLHDRLLGVLAVQGERGRAHTQADQDALNALALITASALASARVHTERMAANRREDLRQAELSEALLNLETAIAPLDDAREICRRVAAGVVSTLQAERAGVFLLAEKGDAAYLAGKHGMGWDQESIKLREFPLADERPLAVRAMRLRKLLTCGPETELLLAEAEQRGSAIAVPVMVGEEVVGALFAEARNGDRLWREPEQRYLRVLGYYAGLTLRKAQFHRLAQQQAFQVQSVYQSAQVINSELDLSSVLDNILEQAAGVPGAHFAGLILTESEHPKLKAYVRADGRKRELAVKLEDEFFAGVIATREARIASQTADIPPELNELGRLAAVLALPLTVSQRVVGLLLIGRAASVRGEADFDLSLLRYLAEQGALAISRSRYYHQVRTAERHNAILLQASQIASSSLDLREILRTMAASAAGAVNAERASVYVYDGRQFLTPIAVSGFGGEAEQAFGSVALEVDVDPFTRELVRQKRPSQVESRALSQGRLSNWPLLQPDMRRVLGLPLVAGERVLGALFIHERRTRRIFVQEEIDLLLGVARQAAVAVENDELDEQARESLRRERLLAVAGRELSGNQSLEQRLAAVLGHLADILPLQAASVALLDQHDLRVVATYGAAERHVQLPRAELPEGRQVVDYLAQEGRPYVSSTAQAEETSRTAWSYLAVPLIAGGETLGVLQVESERHGAFGERELNLLTALGSEIAGALARERMKAQIQDLTVWKHRAIESREIQEGASRMLAGAIIKLGATNLLAEVDPDQALKELRQAKDLAADSLQQLREGVQTLTPSAEPPRAALPTEEPVPSLAAEVRELVAKFGRETALETQVVIHGDERPVPEPSHTTLLQTLAAGLRNVGNHSDIEHVDVALEFSGDVVQLEVRDDGVGAEGGESQELAHMGSSVQEALEALGGRLELHVAPGAGVAVQVTLPLVATAAAFAR